jgi:hypothetical protein
MDKIRNALGCSCRNFFYGAGVTTHDRGIGSSLLGTDTCYFWLMKVFALRTPGVDVMITIFCDFRHFFGEKMAFFSKPNTQCYDQKFAYFSFVLSQKRQFFRCIFRRKYLKNHNIGPIY